ncbi:hypothetical protein GQ53DRAFT_174819 [Thozetella sp. PMI_491]|nr:hypothetical protein GQ53DRAFT_174819 [Thozetella sp. PMI_491]
MPLSANVPTYLLGTGMVGLGLLGLASPARAYATFGLPYPSSVTSPDRVHPASLRADGPGSAPSPYLYAKAVRDLSYGIAFLAFEATQNAAAVTTMAALTALTGAVDGWVVWRYGGELRAKAWGHWNGTTLIAAWFAFRVLKSS